MLNGLATVYKKHQQDVQNRPLVYPVKYGNGGLFVTCVWVGAGSTRKVPVAQQRTSLLQYHLMSITPIERRQTPLNITRIRCTQPTITSSLSNGDDNDGELNFHIKSAIQTLDSLHWHL